MKTLRLVLVAFLLTAGFSASAQRWSVGTNAIDWATFGTINLEGSVAVSQHFTVHLGAELNPWTFNAGNQEKQFQVRQNSYWTGARWWPWHVYSGWWGGADIRYMIYNAGGVTSRETQEGEVYGLGLYGGYGLMLNEFLNLDFGAGVWGGWTNYTRYACPLCGVRTDEGTKPFFLPDARVALQFIF